MAYKPLLLFPTRFEMRQQSNFTFYIRAGKVFGKVFGRATSLHPRHLVTLTFIRRELSENLRIVFRYLNRLMFVRM